MYMYVHLRYEKPYASPTNDDSMKRYGLLLRCKVSKKLVIDSEINEEKEKQIKEKGIERPTN